MLTLCRWTPFSYAQPQKAVDMRHTDLLRRNSFEVQFWGYEIGNVIASMTGAGGVGAFLFDLHMAWQKSGMSVLGAAAWLAQHFPETFSTIGVILMVVLAHPVAKMAGRMGGHTLADAVNICVVPLALGLLGYAVAHSASFFTVAACSFVAGSSLLRGAGEFPLFLKVGGLLLSIGGLALGAAGLGVLTSGTFGDGAVAIALGCTTALTGAYVAGAGLLTYSGGIGACNDAPEVQYQRRAVRLVLPSGPVGRVLKRRVDPLIAAIVRNCVLPSLFWVEPSIKASHPFWTSMLARLPWRFAAGALALTTGTEAGIWFAVANALWAVGDIAIGVLDGEPEPAIIRPQENGSSAGMAPNTLDDH